MPSLLGTRWGGGIAAWTGTNGARSTIKPEVNVAYVLRKRGYLEVQVGHPPVAPCRIFAVHSMLCRINNPINMLILRDHRQVCMGYSEIAEDVRGASPIVKQVSTQAS